MAVTRRRADGVGGAWTGSKAAEASVVASMSGAPSYRIGRRARKSLGAYRESRWRSPCCEDTQEVRHAGRSRAPEAGSTEAGAGSGRPAQSRPLATQERGPRRRSADRQQRTGGQPRGVVPRRARRRGRVVRRLPLERDGKTFSHVAGSDVGETPTVAEGS